MNEYTTEVAGMVGTTMYVKIQELEPAPTVVEFGEEAVRPRSI